MRKLVKLDQLSPEQAALAPRYARGAMTQSIPKYELAEGEMDPDSAYQLIHDELLLDGSARLNLATFVTTWMEPQEQLVVDELVGDVRIHRVCGKLVLGHRLRQHLTGVARRHVGLLVAQAG